MTFIAFCQKRARALVCLFFAAILLLGVLTVTDYGRPWDELGEIGIFRMAIMEYGELLPFETGFHQALSDMGVIPLSQSIEMDHNASLYYPIAWAACNPAISINQLAVIWRVYTWLVFTLACFALYAVCRKMGLSRPMGCLAALLLLLSPRFFAEGHYNNKDLALMSITAVVIWQTIRLAEKPTYPRALLFALACGICINTRIVGAAICGLCGLFVVLRLAGERALCARVWRVGLTAALGTLVCYTLLTPALLHNPGAYLGYVVSNSYNFSRWKGNVLFMGKPYRTALTALPFYYLPVMMLLTTPLLALCLIAVGQVLALGRAFRQKLSMLSDNEGFTVALCSLLWVVPLLASILLRARVYNGWRHFYFLYIPMLVVGVYGLNRLWQWLRPKAVPRRIACAVLAVCLGAQGALIAANHPYQYAYYNSLVPRAILEDSFELDYWNLSVKQALDALRREVGEERIMRIACMNSQSKSGLATNFTLFSPQEEAAHFEYVPYNEADRDSFFLLANTTYQLLSGVEVPADMEPVVSVEAFGVTLCTIYATKAMKESMR